MRLPSVIDKIFNWSIDRISKLVPKPVPEKGRLQNCKIISHRGEYDNKKKFENTLEAFDIALEKGIWGIEFDIRWTKDQHPVIFHDEDFMRLFNTDIEIRNLTLEELKNKFPVIPTLEEVIERYGGKLHLMIELREKNYTHPAHQIQVLKEILSKIKPVKDFHLISVTPGMFKLINYVPSKTFLPIARIKVKKISEITLFNMYGGLLGHYFLLSDKILRKHKKSGQNLGTGFISTKNCFYGEINRGIEWIFSKKAIYLQEQCNAALEKIENKLSR